MNLKVENLYTSAKKYACKENQEGSKKEGRKEEMYYDNNEVLIACFASYGSGMRAMVVHDVESDFLR